MNNYQELWWKQARSDHDVLVHFRLRGFNPCHQLHYLQMATEKLAKAYFWRSGTAPPMSHVGIRQFLKRLGTAGSSERRRIAKVFDFNRFDDFQNWIHLVSPLAYELERLAPAFARGVGPNPEYPWPHVAPAVAPVSFSFGIWKELTETGRGRQLQQAIDAAVEKFPIYA